ncbi:cold-shock protein [Pseudomonas sichuanensis]|uniref:cold-shock protein n=1 Tax=Pseudomonas sichuanensis TaxID=2213015 RepID=UPI0038224D30
MATRAMHSGFTTVAQADPDYVVPHESEVIFLQGAVGDGKPVIREGQHVSYELAQGPDGLWYAVNIVIEDEPYLN